jgi:uncharacterized membrane protein YuzA (DUF378 family)
VRKKMKDLEKWCWWVAVAGAINWGLVGLGNWLKAGDWNVVELLLGRFGLANLAYVLIGAAGLWLLWSKVEK